MNADTIVSVVVLAWAGMCVALPVAYIVVQTHKVREQIKVWRVIKALDDALQAAAAEDLDIVIGDDS